MDEGALFHNRSGIYQYWLHKIILNICLRGCLQLWQSYYPSCCCHCCALPNLLWRALRQGYCAHPWGRWSLPKGLCQMYGSRRQQMLAALPCPPAHQVCPAPLSQLDLMASTRHGSKMQQWDMHKVIWDKMLGATKGMSKMHMWLLSL